VTNTLKPTNRWHFKISKCKRLFVKRTSEEKKISRNRTITVNNVKVRGEIPYLSNCGCYQSLFLPGKTARDINPQPILATNVLSNAKRNDVKRLLVKHYGENWFDINELRFFVDAMNAAVPPDEEPEQVQEICQAAEEEPILII
jgi:hypothetical protein